MTPEQLINFEARIASLFNDGKLQHVIHLSGGNEEKLIEIFKEIHQNDWKFSTWRSHYHALLSGMDPKILEAKIMAAKAFI